MPARLISIGTAICLRRNKFNLIARLMAFLIGGEGGCHSDWWEPMQILDSLATWTAVQRTFTQRKGAKNPFHYQKQSLLLLFKCSIYLETFHSPAKNGDGSPGLRYPGHLAFASLLRHQIINCQSRHIPAEGAVSSLQPSPFIARHIHLQRRCRRAEKLSEVGENKPNEPFEHHP